ncbi:MULTISPECIES: PTS sugar transporter subunit IIA [Marinobacterium]|jgi:PTS system nitrogen regulatory IIA component|uniref:PTS IIA-like nitrogen-regulatory protein PtsN n=1 Tax=Marinobacterium iners DSM 11526 TaxID=1122198 RepID=A0A1H3XSE9_9GAMM|nr:PTS sugar transporter subunit IIA [Marinobacterium iners]QSR34024.1 PTS fructose transporter subunit IIA [Marinobacterium iners]SEA01458.1 PTS IIA-like nitrogen-regulatory protein PtsN [Marinobacterium iners DSM 11526]
MQLSELLTSSRTLCHVDVVSKKRALELASQTIAEQLDGMAAEDIFSGLINRERLGSTGIGEGVAIPHCRIPGVTTAIGLLMTLSSPIDFDAIDNRPVDLICFLLVPEDGAEEHLQTLAGLAELFNDSSTRESLRSCEDSSSLLDRVQTLCRGA